jgi:hypothetical protein
VRALRRPQVLVRGSTSRHATGLQSEGDASCMRTVRSHRPAFYLESQLSDVAGDAQQVEPAARRLALIARALRRHGSSLHPATPADKSFDSIRMLVSWNWAFRLLPHATSVDGSSPWAESVLPAPSLRRTTPDPSAQAFLPLPHLNEAAPAGLGSKSPRPFSWPSGSESTPFYQRGHAFDDVRRSVLTYGHLS